MAERRSVVIIAVTVAIFLGVVGLWAFLSSQNSGGPSPSGPFKETTDPGQIEKVVQLSHLGIATGENYLGYRVRYVIGTLKNVTTDTPVRMVEVKLVFMDFTGKAIHENVAKAHEATSRPLAPGSEQEFQVGFEDLPRSWNRRVPRVEILRVAY